MKLNLKTAMFIGLSFAPLVSMAGPNDNPRFMLANPVRVMDDYTEVNVDTISLDIGSDQVPSLTLFNSKDPESFYSLRTIWFKDENPNASGPPYIGNNTAALRFIDLLGSGMVTAVKADFEYHDVCIQLKSYEVVFESEARGPSGLGRELKRNILASSLDNAHAYLPLLTGRDECLISTKQGDTK